MATLDVHRETYDPEYVESASSSYLGEKDWLETEVEGCIPLQLGHCLTARLSQERGPRQSQPPWLGRTATWARKLVSATTWQRHGPTASLLGVERGSR
jgi:hypothetical protein